MTSRLREYLKGEMGEAAEVGRGETPLAAASSPAPSGAAFRESPSSGAPSGTAEETRAGGAEQ